MYPDASMTIVSLSRPKTVGYRDNQPKLLRHSSLRNIYGRKCPITLLGEKEYLGFKQSRPYSAATFFSSSSSPSVPYSTADILYNGETTRSSITDDYSPNDLVYSDKVSGRLKENNDNRRPNSRNTSRRSISLEKVSINGDREDLQPIKTTTISKQNHFRPTGIRQSYLRGEQFYSNNNSPSKTGSNSSTGNGGVQKDDLVAMGTLWNPNAPRSNGVAVSNSKQYPNSGSNNLPPRRGGPSTSRFAMGAGSSRQPARDVEPKYTDPAIGATNSFQQRLIDLSALEADTVRWERSKKVKKKPKQDRDS
ncbi:hypothetical protein LOTGIDRAFT_227898 [Lottia gigantea]|uniref:Uncharacterized protein n=1 Tax=Lottia gigantea TaxID=225164 RepID=V4B469_LOTGI|nr:hypothetical protein LOTGIDRAFT_227898 [Lottia gigantea]ESP05243.1 hypothetical protein LOTGIDRAFT_227898 [Lottia gigantea]